MNEGRTERVVPNVVPAHRGRQFDNGPAGGSVSPHEYAGFRWGLISIEDGTTTIPIAFEAGAFVEFRPDSTVYIKDAVNTLSGSYEVTGDSVTISPLATTLAGYFGNDPARKAVMAAFRSVFFPNPDGGNGPVTAGLAFNATTLSLTIPPYILTFERS